MLRTDVVRALSATFVQVNALSILENARSDAVAASTGEIALCDRIRERSILAITKAREQELRAKRVYLDVKAKRKNLENDLLEADNLRSSRKSDQDVLIAMKDSLIEEKSSKRNCLRQLGECPPTDDSIAVSLPSLPNLHVDEKQEEEIQSERSEDDDRKRKRSAVMPPNQSPGPIKKRRTQVEEAGAQAGMSSERTEANKVNYSSEGKWLYEEGHAFFFGLQHHAISRVRGRLMIVASCRLKYPLARIMCLHYGWANEVRDILPQPVMAQNLLSELRLHDSFDVWPLLVPKEDRVSNGVMSSRGGGDSVFA